MNPLQDILSSIDPTTARIFSANPPVQRLASGSPKPTPAQRHVKPTNAASEAPVLKRKASGPVDLAQNKVPRKDVPAPLQTNGAARTGPAPAGSRSTSTTPTTSMPYRGTAGLGASKSANTPVKKPLPAGAGQAATVKAAASAPKPTAPRPAGAASGATPAPPKKAGGYLAMLQKAKEKEATKPAAPPIKHEPTKIMTKKDREQARLAAKAASKGKKPTPGAPSRTADAKVDAAKEKRKPADLGYQGTARPAKKPLEIGYKGTARPSTAVAPAARPGASAATKKKVKPAQDRYSGYAEWSDLDDMEDDDEEEEEDDYASDASSDMEGGMWDLEKEETEALKAAKREDAEALAEENELKRAKEERKRKLAALSKATAAKRKY